MYNVSQNTILISYIQNILRHNNMFISYIQIVLRTLTGHKIALFHNTDTSLSYLLNDNATQQFKKFRLYITIQCVYMLQPICEISRFMKWLRVLAFA